MPSLKIATWNVNGIRAREAQFLEWLEREQPDVVCLQELKAASDHVPSALCEMEGYWCYWHGGRGYSGVALLVAARAGAEVYEYAPLEVKLAVVGTGSASKDQMRFMVARLLSGSFRTETPDAADALAVAICHIHSRKVRALGGAPR